VRPPLRKSASGRCRAWRGAASSILVSSTINSALVLETAL